MRSLFSFVALASSAAAASIPKRSLPINNIVAFGDELSDTGTGSYAHGITGDPANVYGFGTWYATRFLRPHNGRSMYVNS